MQSLTPNQLIEAFKQFDEKTQLLVLEQLNKVPSAKAQYESNQKERVDITQTRETAVR